jgi:2-aminoadipate transaminase
MPPVTPPEPRRRLEVPGHPAGGLELRTESPPPLPSLANLDPEDLSIRLSSTVARTSSPSISLLMHQALSNPEVISLAAGFVDQQSLPVETTAHWIGSILANPDEGRRALQYGTTIGHLGLRSRLIERLERTDRVTPGTYREAVARTVVTAGSAQLIYLICEALLDPGDVVLVEAPTYFVFLGPVESRGARAVRVAVDDQGLRLDALEATLEWLESRGELARVKLIYTIPEHANPTGISLAEDRRGPLVELVQQWSKRAGQRIFILEDGAYHGLSLAGEEPPSVWSHDREHETVILARTFSKTFSPGLKIGYGVLPVGLVDPVLRLKGNHDFGSSNFSQVVLERVLASGDYDRHVDRLRQVYGRKLEVFLNALDEALGPYRPAVSWTQPRGGLFVWMSIPEGLDTGFDAPLFRRCIAEGVLYVPGEFAFAREPSPVPRNHLRLSFGIPGEEALVEGVRRLAAAFGSLIQAG